MISNLDWQSGNAICLDERSNLVVVWEVFQQHGGIDEYRPSYSCCLAAALLKVRFHGGLIFPASFKEGE